MLKRNHWTPCLLLAASIAASAPAPEYPGPERLRALMVGAPHSFEGAGLAERMVLESLTNIRFTFAPVPYAGGDRAMDVDGMHGKDDRMIPLR